MTSYKTPLNVVLFLEWNPQKLVWEESHDILREILQTTLHVFANSSVSHVTFSGQERKRREWPLLTDASRITRSAYGVPMDSIMQTIPYEIMTEFDELLFSQRIGRVPRITPSARTKEIWDMLSRDPLIPESTNQTIQTFQTYRTLPKHIYDIVLADAVRTNKECPIAMEPITLENGSVTICGHVFTKSALSHWLKDNDTCPECRMKL